MDKNIYVFLFYLMGILIINGFIFQIGILKFWSCVVIVNLIFLLVFFSRIRLSCISILNILLSLIFTISIIAGIFLLIKQNTDNEKLLMLYLIEIFLIWLVTSYVSLMTIAKKIHPVDVLFINKVIDKENDVFNFDKFISLGLNGINKKHNPRLLIIYSICSVSGAFARTMSHETLVFIFSFIPILLVIFMPLMCWNSIFQIIYSKQYKNEFNKELYLPYEI